MTDEAQPHPTRVQAEIWLAELRELPFVAVSQKNLIGTSIRTSCRGIMERLLLAYLEALETIKAVGDKFDTFCPPEEVSVLRARIAELELERKEESHE